MGWTSRSEESACCPGPHGAVARGEHIARLLHNKLTSPPGDPFLRSHIFPDMKKGFSNVCGEADGLSVVRSSTLSENDVRQRSAVFAQTKTGSAPDGAFVASVDELRAIEVDSRKGEKIVFIYDDPLSTEHLHAVLRGLETLDRPEQSMARDRIRDAFSQKITA